MHDQHSHHWSPSQDTQQQHWSSFQQSHSSPTAAGMPGPASGLHHSHSAGPPGYQTEPFAMPGLSNLQSMRQQPGSDHSLFSGSSNVPGFPPSQFRQRSRFHFAQDQSAALAPHFAGPSMFSSLVSPALQQHSNAMPVQHGHDQLQYNSQHPDHQLFTSSSGLSGGSLFSGTPGMSKSNSVPHQHMAVGSPGRHVGNMTACMMGPPGGLQVPHMHMHPSHGKVWLYPSMPMPTAPQLSVRTLLLHNLVFWSSLCSPRLPLGLHSEGQHTK